MGTAGGIMKRYLVLAFLFLLSTIGTSFADDPKRVEPNDPFFRHQWWADNNGKDFISYDPTDYRQKIVNLKKDIDIDLPEAWAIEQGSSDCLIAILGNGFQYDHEDLTNRFDKVNGYNFLLKNKTMSFPTRHGTDLAGIVAAEHNNNIGIAGIAPNCKVLPIVVKSSLTDINDKFSPNQRSNAWHSGIQHAIKQKATVILISYSLATKEELHQREASKHSDGKAPLYRQIEIDREFSFRMEVIHNAIKDAYLAGIPVVAAAGNEDKKEDRAKKHYPAAWKEVISVASLKPTGKPSSFAVYGDWVDVSAPGEFIFTTSFQTESLGTIPCGFERLCSDHPFYEHVEGSSYSAAMVAGVVALLRSHYPTMTVEEIRNTLIKSGKPIKSKIKVGPLVKAAAALQNPWFEFF